MKGKREIYWNYTYCGWVARFIVRTGTHFFIETAKGYPTKGHAKAALKRVVKSLGLDMHEEDAP